MLSVIIWSVALLRVVAPNIQLRPSSKKNVSPPDLNVIKLFFFVTDAQDKKARVYVPVKLLGLVEKKTRVRIHNTSVSS